MPDTVDSLGLVPYEDAATSRPHRKDRWRGTWPGKEARALGPALFDDEAPPFRTIPERRAAGEVA